MGSFQDAVADGNPDDLGEINNISDAIDALSKLDDKDNYGSELGALVAHLENEADPHKAANELGVTIVDSESDLTLGDMEDGAEVYIRERGSIAEYKQGEGLNVHFPFIGEFETLSDFDDAASSGDKGYIIQEQQFARQP